MAARLMGSVLARSTGQRGIRQTKEVVVHGAVDLEIVVAAAAPGDAQCGPGFELVFDGAKNGFARAKSVRLRCMVGRFSMTACSMLADVPEFVLVKTEDAIAVTTTVSVTEASCKVRSTDVACPRLTAIPSCFPSGIR